MAPYSLLLVAGAAHLATADQIPTAVADKLGGACKLNAGGCCDFSGEWCNHANSDGIFKTLFQDTGSCVVYGMLQMSSGDHAGSGRLRCTNGTVSGDTLSMFCKGKTPSQDMTRTLTLSLSTPQDVGQWHYPGPNGRSKWWRGGNYGNYTCRTNKTTQLDQTFAAADTCSLYEISDGSCGQSDLDCAYTKYAKAAEKGLKDGTCADQGYTHETGTQTKTYPIIGDIVITTYDQALASTDTTTCGCEGGTRGNHCCIDAGACCPGYMSCGVGSDRGLCVSCGGYMGCWNSTKPVASSMAVIV